MYVPVWILIPVALLVGWLLAKQRRPAADFSPFQVRIRPEWRALLNEHLDMTPERWTHAEQWIANHPREESRLWRDGLMLAGWTPLTKEPEFPYTPFQTRHKYARVDFTHI